MRISQPTAGSFRFRVRFSTHSKQLQLFESEDIVPTAVLSDNFQDILEAAQEDDPATLQDLVKDGEYRDAFLRLVRTIVPDGKRVGEVEVRRLGSRREASTVLRPAAKKVTTSRVLEGKPARGQPESELEDVLRAIHLNQGWIVLGTEGRDKKCFVGEGIVLTDVAENLVNHRVRVTLERRRNRLYVTDLIEAGEQPDSSASPSESG